MTDLPLDFAAHLVGEVTTLCHCWVLERRDGTRFGFTDHDGALTLDGTACEPAAGLAQSEARATMGLAVDASEVEGALTSDRIAAADIDDGLYDGATVATYLVNWQEPGQNVLLRKAAVGRIKRVDGRFVAELESLAAALDRPSGRTLRRTCDARLGDARCSVTLDGPEFTGEGAVLGRVAPATLAVAGLGAYEPGWFSHGVVTWTSGGLEGRTANVIDHRATAEGTLLALPAGTRLPENGDTFAIVAGCDKRFATCRQKFVNSINFRGFPHLPGNDAAYAYVSEGAVFDGGALVP